MLPQRLHLLRKYLLPEGQGLLQPGERRLLQDEGGLLRLDAWHRHEPAHVLLCGEGKSGTDLRQQDARRLLPRGRRALHQAVGRGQVSVLPQRLHLRERRMRRLATSVVALGASLTLVAPPGQSTSTARAVKPFAYDFRLVDFTMTATLTYSRSKATTRYELDNPSKPLRISYLGPRVSTTAYRRTWTVAPVTASATGTYTSPDPACTRTISYKAAAKRTRVIFGWHPPVGAKKRISAGVGRIPLAEPHPGQDDGGPGALPAECGKPVFGNWYQDAIAYAPIGMLATKPRVTVKGHHRERFTDPGIESIEWEITAVLQRVRHTPIDCAEDKGC